MKTNTPHTPASDSPAPYAPLPEAESLAKLLATDTSVDAMAAVLIGFLRSREKSHQKESKALRDALADIAHGFIVDIGENGIGSVRLGAEEMQLIASKALANFSKGGAK